MALGALLKVGVKTLTPSVRRALSKAVDPVKKTDARLIGKVQKKFGGSYEDAKDVVRISQALSTYGGIKVYAHSRPIPEGYVKPTFKKPEKNPNIKPLFPRIKSLMQKNR